MLFGITRPIEEAVNVVPGVTRVQSRTIRGSAEVNITFAPRIDMQHDGGGIAARRMLEDLIAAEHAAR